MSYDQLIHEYEVGGEKLRNAIKGATPEDLLAYPVPGTWSIQEIVIHMMDSDLIGTDRMKRTIAQDQPQLIGYDETAFIKNLYPAEQSIEDALTIFDLNRKMFTRILRRLPAEAFERTANHNERGVLTLGQQLKSYVNHLDHHIKFIIDKREMLGNIMW